MEKMDHKANKLITLGVVLWVSFLSAAGSDYVVLRYF